MTADLALIDRLKADVAVAAIVGTRVYRLILPQHPTLPAIRVQRISRITEGHLRGGSANCWGTYQVDAIANEYDSANPDGLGTLDNLTAAIRESLAFKAFVAQESPLFEVSLVKPVNEGPDLKIVDELNQVKTPMDFEVYWREDA